MRRRSEEREEGRQDFFTISISDLMASLLAIFMLTICYFILNFSQATAQLTQNDVTRAELLMHIHERLEQDGIKVTIDEQHGILRISEGVLFDVGAAEVKPEGRRVIQKLGMILADVLQSDEFADTVETIFIEGHTDDVPINSPDFPSNWELSTKRAINTWRLMVADSPLLDQLKNENGQPIFSCSGYAETRPIADNAESEGRRANRRIDIRFTMTPPGEDDMSIVKFVHRKMSDE